MMHADREAWRIFWRVLLKHLKRGNWHPRPNPVIAWRCAMAGRWICRGCPAGKAPRYLVIARVPPLVGVPR